MRDRNLVELVGIRKAFGDNVVLDGVDLSVARGEVIVIAGPSGSGKSTMLRCVNGLETRRRGRGPLRRPAGDDRARRLSALRAQIGFVFQQFHLFPHMTVLQNITLAPVKVKGIAADAGAGDGARAARAGRHRREGRSVPGRPVGRAAAAGGDRAGARHGPEADAVRRADLGARPGDDPGGARRHARPRARRHDDAGRHARDGLRPRGVRPAGVHRRRPDRGGGAARGVLRQRAVSERAREFVDKIIHH